jgi:hypothetical protein
MTPSKRRLDLNIVQSNFHIEITPRCVRRHANASISSTSMISEVGNNDRAVIQELLKEIAQTQQVDLNAKQRFKGPSCSPARGCEAAHARPVVIINEADSLTRDAQAALRRTMEKYTTNMRMILCANSTSRLIAPIKSRCLLIRIAAPDEVEVCALSCKCCYFRTDSFLDAQSIGVRGQARKVRPPARSRVRDRAGRQRQPPQGAARARGAQDAVVGPPRSPVFRSAHSSSDPTSPARSRSPNRTGRRTATRSRI